MSSLIKRQEFLLGIIVVVSALIYIPYFIEAPQPMVNVETWLINSTLIISSVAVWIGFYTLIKRQTVRASRRIRGWYYGVLMSVLAVVIVVLGFTVGTNHASFTFLTNSFIVPGDATIYSLLVFFLTSAAARSFKARDLESSMLMITAFVVFLYQAPMAQYLLPFFSPIGEWLTSYLAMAATRVFGFSAALGGIVLAIRLLMGKEMAMIGLLRRKEEEE
jgi:hypothetical protein